MTDTRNTDPLDAMARAISDVVGGVDFDQVAATDGDAIMAEAAQAALAALAATAGAGMPEAMADSDFASDAAYADYLYLRERATALTAASVAKDAEIVRLRAQNNELAQMVADLANRKPLATGGHDA